MLALGGRLQIQSCLIDGRENRQPENRFPSSIPLNRQESMAGCTQPFRGALLEGLIPGLATYDAK